MYTPYYNNNYTGAVYSFLYFEGSSNTGQLESLELKRLSPEQTNLISDELSNKNLPQDDLPYSRNFSYSAKFHEIACMLSLQKKFL